jgi:hypothetical protein
MDPAGRTDSKATSVLIPMAAATAGNLPDICAVTGRPAAGRWIRRAQGMTHVSMPISAELLARYAKRTRAARTLMVGFVLVWAVAVALAVLDANASHSGLLNRIAAWLFLLGLPLFIGGLDMLGKRSRTIPVRWRVVVARDGRQYLRIRNPSPTFADALRGRGLSSSAAPPPQLRARGVFLLVASAVLPVVLAVLLITGHVAVAAGVLIGYAFLAMVGSVVSGILIGTRRGRPPQVK